MRRRFGIALIAVAVIIGAALWSAVGIQSWRIMRGDVPGDPAVFGMWCLITVPGIAGVGYWLMNGESE